MRFNGLWMGVLALVLVLCSLVPDDAMAQTPCYQWTQQVGGVTCTTGSGCVGVFCMQQNILDAAYGGANCNSTGGSCDTPPTGAGQSCTEGYMIGINCCGGTQSPGSLSMGSVLITCPTNPCSSLAGQESFMGGGVPAGLACDTSAGGGTGCEVNAATPTMSISGTGVNSATTYSAPYSGNQCTSGEPTPPPGQCSSGGGQSTCIQQGTNCGTVNGDVVCPQALAPGTCQSYASGGIACAAASGSSAPTSPPAPNSGTSSAPAAPTAEVTSAANGSEPAATAFYYSGAAVAASSAPSQSSGPASVNSSGGTSGLGSSGPVSLTPNAANGDCGASANTADCTGISSGSGLPDTSTTLTYSGIVETFESAVRGSAIMGGVSSIESSWPTGSCDLGTVALATLPGTTLDYTTPFCTFWTAHVESSLSAIMLAGFAVLGVLLILTA